MLPGSNFLSLDSIKTSLQVVDNNDIALGDTELHASFAELLNLPYDDPAVIAPTLPGGTLPLAGSELPPAETLGAAALVADESGRLFVPEEGFALTQQPLATDGINLATEVPIETVLPAPVVADDRLAGNPDELQTALTTNIALQNGRAESDATAYRERQPITAGPRPQVRMSGAEPANTSSNSTEISSDELPGLNRLRNAGGKTAETPVNVMPKSIADNIPDRQQMPRPDPALAVPGMNTDGVSEASKKPLPGIAGNGSPGIVVEAPQASLSPTQVLARSAPTLNFSISVPVTDDGFGEALQDRVMWMAGHRIQNAEIRLNPAELGPIRVQVSVEDDAAKLTFTAQHAVTREAIEQAMPRLREMLSDSGLSLAGSSVHEGDAGETGKGQHAGQDRDTELELAADSGDGAGAEVSVIRQKNSSSLVDTFA